MVITQPSKPVTGTQKPCLYVEIEKSGIKWVVRPKWSGVDRPGNIGYAVETKEVADKLASAFRDGKAYSNAHVELDIHSKTFIKYEFMLYRNKNYLRQLIALGY